MTPIWLSQKVSPSFERGYCRQIAYLIQSTYGKLQKINYLNDFSDWIKTVNMIPIKNIKEKDLVWSRKVSPTVFADVVTADIIAPVPLRYLFDIAMSSGGIGILNTYVDGIDMNCYVISSGITPAPGSPIYMVQMTSDQTIYLKEFKRCAQKAQNYLAQQLSNPQENINNFIAAFTTNLGLPSQPELKKKLRISIRELLKAKLNFYKGMLESVEAAQKANVAAPAAELAPALK
jgi:hypothetical protein